MKKIKAEHAKPGKLYLVRGKPCTCISKAGGDIPRFVDHGNGEVFGVYAEKVKPVAWPGLTKKISAIEAIVQDYHGDQYSVTKIEYKNGELIIHTGDYL